MFTSESADKNYMKVAVPTALIFAVLLIAAIANAQFVSQNPYSAPQILPVPSYNPMYMPNTTSNPYSMSPYSQPTYNFSLPTNNFSMPAIDYSIPSFSNPYSSPYDSPYDRPSARSAEDEEERRERDEERREEREERREEKRRERDERKREDRAERERSRRGNDGGDEQPAAKEDEHSPAEEKTEVNNWPPVPKSSARAAEVAPPVLSLAPPATKPAPAKAAEAKPAKAAAVAAPAAAVPKQQNWWESDPDYQKYLKDKKGYEESQKVRPDFPPKPKPVTTVPAPQKQIQSTTGALAASAVTDCESCGPKKGPLAQQVETLRELADPREVFVLTRAPNSKVSEGIRRVINTIYQSCDAYSTLLRPDYCQDGFIGKSYCAKSQPRNNSEGDVTAFKNPEEFFSYKVASQPGSNVMTPVKPEGPSCRDMNKNPPIFKWGGRPQLSSKAGKVTLNLFNSGTTNNTSKFTTMDCSGFVTAAYAAAGLNLVANSPAAQATTRTLRNGEASCVAPVTFSANQSIQSGDIAVFAGGSEHSMIFDRVGEDPFGIKDVATAPSGVTAATHCRSKLDPANFDFVIAQSGLYGGRTAVSQSRAVDYIVNFGNGMMDGINAQIMQLAEDACVAKLSGVSRKAERPNAGKILRHKGASAPGCVRAAPPEIVGQQCVKGCT